MLERFVGKSKYNNHGQRVVAGQRLMQAASDIFLGWQRVTGFDGQVRDFYLRQLRDWKGSADVDTMSASLMTVYARICGATLARAHARSGDRIAIASYLGKSDAFDRAIADFATAYADQNERDYQALVDAVESGRLEAQTGSLATSRSLRTPSAPRRCLGQPSTWTPVSSLAPTPQLTPAEVAAATPVLACSLPTLDRPGTLGTTPCSVSSG